MPDRPQTPDADMIRQALVEHGGQRKAAKALGVPRSVVQKACRVHGILGLHGRSGKPRVPQPYSKEEIIAAVKEHGARGAATALKIHYQAVIRAVKGLGLRGRSGRPRGPVTPAEAVAAVGEHGTMVAAAAILKVSYGTMRARVAEARPCLLAFASEERWAYVREGKRLLLLRPPYTRDTRVTEADVERAVTVHGYTASDRTFTTRQELFDFLSEESVRVWREHHPRVDIATPQEQRQRTEGAHGE